MNRKPGPAETLMGNMMFPTKFTLVSILFLIPLLLTLVLYWQESSQNINRLSSELQGMKLINQLEPVLIAAGEHRGLSHASLNGDNSVAGQLDAVRSKLNQHLSELQMLARQLEAPAGLSGRISQLQQQWQGLTASNGGDAQQRFDQHNEMLKQVRKLFVEVSRSYQLELDSDGETTFLINMAVSELPAVIDESGKLRDAATGIAAKGRFTPDSFIYLSNQLNQVKPAVTELAAYGDRGFSVASGDQLQRQITTAAEKLAELQRFVKSRVIDPDSINVNVSEVFGTGSQNLAPVIKLYTHMMPMLEMLIQERLARLELHRNLVLAVILLAVGAAIYLFIGFYRYTIRTVNDVSQQASRLAAGDLSVRLQPRGNDEMRAVTEGFNQVADGFQQLVRQAVSSTELVAQAAMAMTSESGQTLQGAAQQKREADAIAMAISELAHSAEDIAGHSAVAADSAQRADEMATEGRNVVQHTARSFTGMMDEVARTSEVISQLDKDVQAIGDISTVIREIAEQTNLLALNAAIEAARAGEQGRGFAVVADEVRNLSKRTQSSTEEIQQTIESLQACTRDSVELMASTHSQVSANVEEIDKAGALLKAIDDIVADMNQKNAQIASAVQAQNLLVERLQGNITTVADVADSTESSARQSASLAEDMSHSSGQLQQSLAAFRIG